MQNRYHQFFPIFLQVSNPSFNQSRWITVWHHPSSSLGHRHILALDLALHLRLDSPPPFRRINALALANRIAHLEILVRVGNRLARNFDARFGFRVREFKDPGAGNLEMLVANETEDFGGAGFGEALVLEVGSEVVGRKVAEGTA